MFIDKEKIYPPLTMQTISFETYVLDIIDRLYYAYYDTCSKIKILTNIEHITLPLEKMVPCALIIHELIANSLQHAFPHNIEGTVIIDLFKKNKQEYILMVSDNGKGLPESINIKYPVSSGLQQIHRLIKQLAGSCEYYNDDGASFVITFPLN